MLVCQLLIYDALVLSSNVWDLLHQLSLSFLNHYICVAVESVSSWVCIHINAFKSHRSCENIVSQIWWLSEAVLCWSMMRGCVQWNPLTRLCQFRHSFFIILFIMSSPTSMVIMVFFSLYNVWMTQQCNVDSWGIKWWPQMCNPLLPHGMAKTDKSASLNATICCGIIWMVTLENMDWLFNTMKMCWWLINGRWRLFGRILTQHKKVSTMMMLMDFKLRRTWLDDKDFSDIKRSKRMMWWWPMWRWRTHTLLLSHVTWPIWSMII